MINAIKAFFEENILMAVVKKDGSQTSHALKLATTVLLVEMMRMDDVIQETEKSALLAQVKAQFDMRDQEAQTLFELAETELKDSTDYYQFTSLINQHFEYSDKVKIIESLWQIAYVDQHLDHDEEYLVRKISELIYVKHEDFITAKLRIKNAL